VRVNQAGYLPGDIKNAVLISTVESDPSFEVFEAITGKKVFSGRGKSYNAAVWGMKSAYRLDFSGVTHPGGYYILASGQSLRYSELEMMFMQVFPIIFCFICANRDAVITHILASFVITRWFYRRSPYQSRRENRCKRRLA